MKVCMIDTAVMKSLDDAGCLSDDGAASFGLALPSEVIDEVTGIVEVLGDKVSPKERTP